MLLPGRREDGESIEMRILLAEDEKALSRVIVKIFERNNYSIDAVYDGEEALDYLDAGNYDFTLNYDKDDETSSIKARIIS